MTATVELRDVNGASVVNGHKGTNGTNGIKAIKGTRPPTPWRVYLYGGGNIAWRHGISAGFIGEHVELFAADPSKEAREGLISRFPHANIFDNAEDMLASSEGREHDIVVVAVPPWLHHSATLQAFASGRHVLCEKPVARTQIELKEMLAAGETAGREFADCSQRYLGNGALDRARKLIEGNAIGSVYHARLVNRAPRSRPGIEYQPTSRWFLSKEKSGGGAIFDWGVYDLAMFFDVLRPIAVTVHYAWMATPPTAADPAEHPISVETHAGAALTLKLASGAIVPVDYERACGFHGEPQAIISVDGTKGGLSWNWIPMFDVAAEVDETDEKDFTLLHYADENGQVVTKEEKFPAFGWEDANHRPLQSFVDLLEGRDSVTLSKARMEFNFEVLTAMYQSAAEGKAIHVELKE